METLVFSAQRYRWSRTQKDTLDNLGPYRLWRIRPDGRGLVPLTDTRHDLGAPKLSPDGKGLIASDSTDRVWRLPVRGGALTSAPKAYAGTFSPDGKYIARTDYPDGDDNLVLYDTARRTSRTVKGVGDFAWSADSRRLFVVRPNFCALLEIDTLRMAPAPRLFNPTWLADGSVLGDDHGDSGGRSVVPLLWRPTQAEPEKLPLVGAPEQWWSGGITDVLPRCRRWSAVPRSPHRYLVECWGSMSDGTHYSCALVDLAAKTYRRLLEGRLVSISPDGRRIAAAREEWVGEYKRGGRRCGPLEIVDLATGKRRAITDELVSVAGGVWKA